MANDKKKFIALTYKLYTVEDGEKDLREEVKSEQPYMFISGYGLNLEGFEEEMVKHEKGDHFDITISKDKAFGEYDEQHVYDLDKKKFEIDGKFDDKNIKEGAFITVKNEDGQLFNALVLEITADTVTIDLNHPYAGCDLNFVGEILENREATEEEIESLENHLNGKGCGDCNCESCGGDCEGHCH